MIGTKNQTVNYGANTTGIAAAANNGYHFLDWTGTGGLVISTTNPLTVINVTETQTITANFAIDNLLFVTLSGNGNGSAHSSPLTDISCITGSTVGCSGRIRSTDITLTASPDDKTSIFDGWTNACTTLEKDCVVTMTSDKTAVASFTLAPKSKVDISATAGFETLPLAYSNAVSTIFALDGEGLFSGEWLLDKTKNIVFKGGYQADYKLRTGFTILNGSMVIKAGSLRVDGLIVKPSAAP